MAQTSTAGLPPQSAPAEANSFRFTGADAGLCAILIAAVLAMFWKVLFAGQMLYYRDILNQTYPEMAFVHEVMRRGMLPLWNPYLNFGQPLLANPNSLVLYPTTILILALPLRIAFALHFVIHFAIAAVGAYCLARAWRQSRLGSVFAGLIFGLSGPVLSLGSFYNEVAAAAWIPWALFLTDRALQARSARRWVVLSVVLGLQFLAGEPFTLLATFVLCLAYAFHRRGKLRPPISRVNISILAAFAAAGSLMAGLVAVQLIPALGLLGYSLRGRLGMPFSLTTYWSLHPFSFLEMFLPGFFAPPFAEPSLWTPLLNFSNRPFFPSIFIGFVPIFLAVVACAAGGERRRKFAGWSAAILLLLAFGRFTPVFSLAYVLIPPLELVRFPIKLLTPFALFIALLAGWGIDDVRGSLPSPPRPLRKLFWPVGACFVGAVTVWILSWIAPKAIQLPADWIFRLTGRAIGGPDLANLPSRMVESAGRYFVLMVRWRFLELAGYTLGGLLWLRALIQNSRWSVRLLPYALALAVIELGAANYGVNPTVPSSFYTYRPPVLSHFEPSSMPYRYADVFGSNPLASVTQEQANSNLSFGSIAAARNLNRLALKELQEQSLLEHGGMLFHAASIDNTDVDLSFPPQLFRFWVFALHEAPNLERAACLFGRVNVRYQVVGRPVDIPELREVSEIATGSPYPAYLYENRCFVPRAYVAGVAKYSPSVEATVAALSSPGFDPSSEVLVDQREAVSSAAPGMATAGQIEALDAKPNHVTLKVNLSRPGYVVLLDRFDPNWHATLDGLEVPILQADLLFRAVRVGPGIHEIQFVYRQRGLCTGMAISLAGLVLALVLIIRDPAMPGVSLDS